MNFKTLAIATVAATAGILGGYYFNTLSTPKTLIPPHIQGAILPHAKILSNFNLIDQNGKPFTPQRLKNHWSIVFAGYTHCPDVCPNTLSVLAQMVKLMKEQNIKPPQVFFLSVDPARDTPELLSQFVTYFDKDFVGVTGDSKMLTAVATQLSVVFKKAPGMSGDINKPDYLIDHSASLELINPDGRLQAFLTAPHTPMKLIDSIIHARVFYTESHKGK